MRNFAADMSYDFVILADGDFPRHPAARRVLEEARRVVCCDGAAKAYMEATGRRPWAVVGDGDSLTPHYKELLADILHPVAEQDDNDLTKATRFCLEAPEREASAVEREASASRDIDSPRIAYLGATGRREDHTLGNISLINRYARDFGIRPVMITDHGRFTAHCGDDTLTTFARQQVSIFNMDCTTMSSDGLLWPIAAYREWWQGTLNEALGQAVAIHADGRYLVFRTHEPKT